MADALINAGASVSLRDQYGDTPLHYAAFCGSTDVAKKLLAAGADVNSISADGRTALSIAKDESRVDIVNLIMDAATSNSLSTFSSAKEAELTAIGKGAADSAAVFAGGLAPPLTGVAAGAGAGAGAGTGAGAGSLGGTGTPGSS